MSIRPEDGPGPLAAVLSGIRDRGAAAQLCVLRAGEVVVDEAFGCRPDALFWLWSAGKPYLTVVIHRLAQDGAIDLDEPVSRWWPEFAGNGKQAITVRQVLRHRSGLSSAGTAVGEALAMADWRRSIRRIERARPRWPAGQVVAYSPLASGFILGELASRATGRPLRELLRDLVLDPVGATDTYLGLPDEQWHRRVAVRVHAPGGHLVAAVVNRRATRQAVIPAAGICTTARDLARFYAGLLDTDRPGGDALLRPDTLARALIPTSDGELDRRVGAPIRWAQGFQLGGPRWVPGAVTVMGQRSGPRTYGHNGSNCCVGWADPEQRIAYAYLTDRVDAGATGARHHAEVADAVLGAFGGRTT